MFHVDFKGIAHPKMIILSLITRSHVVPNPKYFIWPCIDSKKTTTFKAQKGWKDIVKIVHVE